MTAIPHVRIRPAGARLGSRSGSSVRARLIRPGTGDSDGIGNRRSAGRWSRGRRRSNATAEAVVAGLPVSGSVAAPDIRRWSPAGLAPSNLRLVVAGRRIRLGRGAFALASLAALTTILVTLLVLNTALTTGSFELQQLRVKDNRLVIQEQELLGKLSVAQSPVGLQTKARELGMVPATSPVFLRLTDQSVLGEGDPARMPPAPATPKVRDKKRNPGAPVDPALAGPGGESAAELVEAIGGIGAGTTLPKSPSASPGFPSAPTMPDAVGGAQASAGVGAGGETGVGLLELGR